MYLINYLFIYLLIPLIKKENTGTQTCSLSNALKRNEEATLPVGRR